MVGMPILLCSIWYRGKSKVLSPAASKMAPLIGTHSVSSLPAQQNRQFDLRPCSHTTKIIQQDAQPAQTWQTMGNPTPCKNPGSGSLECLLEAPKLLSALHAGRSPQCTALCCAWSVLQHSRNDFCGLSAPFKLICNVRGCPVYVAEHGPVEVAAA